MIDLYDPDGYVAGPPHEVFARLRREQPVFWQAMPDGTGYWAVLRHADVVHVARDPTLFSAAIGGVVLEDLPPEQLGDDAGHVAGDGPAAARRLPAQRRAAVQGPGDGAARAADPRDLPRRSSTTPRDTATSTSSTTCAPSCRRRSSASSWASRARTGRGSTAGRR